MQMTELSRPPPSLLILDGTFVRLHLSYVVCIPLVREAMMALSRGQSQHPLRSIVDLDHGRAFGVMLGAMPQPPVFGAKLVSVFPYNARFGLQSHQGAVLLFDEASGAPMALVHAGEVTRIRTAAASAAATDALARKDATRRAVLGYGELAEAHIHSMAAVRPLSNVTVWGRDPDRARQFARRCAEETGIAISAVGHVEDAVRTADIVCTTTAAAEPILSGRWLPEGCHVNVVGSSRAGPAEIDSDLVVRSRFFADDRASVLQQGAEFLRAKAAGLVTDAHVLAEIGAVFDGCANGRDSSTDITVYKSLGSVVQDLATAWYLYRHAADNGLGARVAF